MPSATVPAWLVPLLRAPPARRHGLASALLASGRPWAEVKGGLATAVLVDPSSSRGGLEALLASPAARGADLRGRLLALLARAIHRSGSLADALAGSAAG